MPVCTDCSFSVVVTLQVNVINWIQDFLTFFTLVFLPFFREVSAFVELQNVDAITIFSILYYLPLCCDML